MNSTANVYDSIQFASLGNKKFSEYRHVKSLEIYVETSWPWSKMKKMSKFK